MTQGDTLAKNQHSEEIVAEYAALREEILFRLRVQQDMISYSFLAAGFLATLLGVNIDPRMRLVIILMGPIMCVFLQLIYTKQHLFVELLAKYVSTELGIESAPANSLSRNNSAPFDGWEDYLSSFYIHSRLNLYSKILGYAEGGFPTLVGLLFLATAASLFLVDRAQFLNDYLVLALAMWGAIDLVGLGAAVFVGTRVRGWVAERRKSEVTEVYRPGK